MERLRNQFMQDQTMYSNLHLEKDPRFGEVEKFPPGCKFPSRQECSDAGVHRQTFAGISGNPELGAFSVVLSGGYEDDEDKGNEFIYTGTGGQQDSFSVRGKQVRDQSFEHPDNASLLKSAESKRPVRVVRGVNTKSHYAPREGYRYDGLYIVERAYLDKGISGFAVCKYVLKRIRDQRVIDCGDGYYINNAS